MNEREFHTAMLAPPPLLQLGGNVSFYSQWITLPITKADLYIVI
jgi:hypothetical protein